MKTLSRIVRHFRIYRRSRGQGSADGPPFLILFVNSRCNMRCGHCFYWRQLNHANDLSLQEMYRLSDELGTVENLNLSGGEPFLHDNLADICRKFVRDNQTREIYIPTNGYYTQRTIEQLRQLLGEPSLRLVAVELSLDGLSEYHDAFRGVAGAFEHAMATYRALAELAKTDSRLVIHAISTASADNMDQVRQLSSYLYEHCPSMAHHNLAIIRGDRRSDSLAGPVLEEYSRLWQYIRRLWAAREVGRHGGIVEPMLHWAKVRAASQRRQVVPCRAGALTGVVYANGDVSLCEQHEPIGNLRQSSFAAIWRSHAARSLRKSIRAGQCHCTNEIFLWSSIAFQPLQLLYAMAAVRPWCRVKPLDGPRPRRLCQAGQST